MGGGVIHIQVHVVRVVVADHRTRPEEAVATNVALTTGGDVAREGEVRAVTWPNQSGKRLKVSYNKGGKVSVYDIGSRAWSSNASGTTVRGAISWKTPTFRADGDKGVYAISIHILAKWVIGGTTGSVRASTSTSSSGTPGVVITYFIA